MLGAGPVGLTLALSLARLGVSCLVVERDGEPGFLPRTELCNPRAMETFGRLGAAGSIRAAGWPADVPMDSLVLMRQPASRVLPVAETRGNVSVHDRVADGGLTLLVMTADPVPSLAAPWIRAARDLEMPLFCRRLDDPVARAVYGWDLLLVRPDLHIACRGNAAQANPAALLARATGREAT